MWNKARASVGTPRRLRFLQDRREIKTRARLPQSPLPRPTGPCEHRRIHSRALQDKMARCILESDAASKGCRKKRANLIRKIHEADPLVCTKGTNEVRILGSLRNKELSPKILRSGHPFDRSQDFVVAWRHRVRSQ
jgi:hypothetical protein